MNAYRKSIENAEKNLAGNDDMVKNLRNVYFQALEKVGDSVHKAVLRKLPKGVNKKQVKFENIQDMLDQGMHEDEITDFY